MRYKKIRQNKIFFLILAEFLFNLNGSWQLKTTNRPCP